MPPVHVSVPSALLGGELHAVVVPPPGSRPAATLPWLYLLHGRGGTLEAMAPLVATLERAMDDGSLDRHVVVVPDGPWLERTAWWVDSAYTGAGERDATGQSVESAVLGELLPAIEGRWGPASQRIVGVSMGGAAALRWAIVHPTLFRAAVLLSPAVYGTQPTRHSSARTSTAFGRGPAPYDHDRWLDLVHYPTLLARRVVGPAALRVVTVTGDAEPVQDDPDGTWTDLDLESARLHAALKRAPAAESSLRIVSGGHGLALWEREVVGAVRRAAAPRLPTDR